MVVDYIGACDIVRKLKNQLEEKLGEELLIAGCAIPPGTENCLLYTSPSPRD